MRVILNGVACDASMSCNSSAGIYTFDSWEDALRVFNSDEKCEYCGNQFRPVIRETVNDKVACPECRASLVPPICVYFDRYRRVHDLRIFDSPMSYTEHVDRAMRLVE